MIERRARINLLTGKYRKEIGASESKIKENTGKEYRNKKSKKIIRKRLKMSNVI